MRIENLLISNGELEIPFSPKAGMLYGAMENELQFMNSTKVYAKWNYGKEQITIKDDKEIQFYPNFDYTSIIVRYRGTTNVHKNPYNAIVYNADGSIHKILEPPILLSPKGLEHDKNLGKERLSDMSFGRVWWNTNSRGQVVLTILVYFFRDHYEERVLNPKTGGFGELIKWGRL